MRLFEGSTRFDGVITKLAPKQNEKEGKFQIEIWDNEGRTIINEQFHVIPDYIKESVKHLEEVTNICSGLHKIFQDWD